MKKNIFALLVVIAVSSLSAQTIGKNLQVLKFESKKEMKAYMETISSDLGVKCVFCHNMNDKSSDEKKHKQIARKMMKMTGNINSDYFSWEGAKGVSCWTCHQGNKEPQAKVVK